MSKKCPKCGAEMAFAGLSSVIWACGSDVFDQGFDQSTRCRIAELEAEVERLTLAAQNDLASEEVNRLQAEVERLRGGRDCWYRAFDRSLDREFQKDAEIAELEVEVKRLTKNVEDVHQLLEESRGIRRELEAELKSRTCPRCKMDGWYLACKLREAEVERLSEPCPTCKGREQYCSGPCHGTGRVSKGYGRLQAEVERLRAERNNRQERQETAETEIVNLGAEIERLSEPCPTCEGRAQYCSGPCRGTGRVSKGYARLQAEVERLLDQLVETQDNHADAANEAESLRRDWCDLVDALPKCWRLADGELVQDEPVVPGMTLFARSGAVAVMGLVPVRLPCGDELQAVAIQREHVVCWTSLGTVGIVDVRMLANAREAAEHGVAAGEERP
ncbi:MAG: hypothetical protein ACYS8L_08465 [Planctomycetota bacterium]|jgi:peptidoglycan hydrolase CwlO-like protein